MAPETAGKIALLFDCLPPRSEAARYAIELAARMNCTLIVVMIRSRENGYREATALDRAPELEKEIRASLEEAADHTGRSGVAAEIMVRDGDPLSESMKFLAGERTLRTIVWGGAKDAVGGRGLPRDTHWLAGMKRLLDCPLVVPSAKS